MVVQSALVILDFAVRHQVEMSRAWWMQLESALRRKNVAEYIYVVLGIECDGGTAVVDESGLMRKGLCRIRIMGDATMPYSNFLLLPFGAGSSGVRVYVTVLVTT